MTIAEAVEYLGLERCEFDDECEYCDTPTGGSYCLLVDQEAQWYACGKCAVELARMYQGDDNAGLSGGTPSAAADGSATDGDAICH